MKKVLVDTNILIDLLAERQPFSKFAIEIFSLAQNNKVKLFTSSHSYATAHYLLKKYMSEADLRKALISLLDFIELVPIDTAIIKKSLLSKHKDFEDAIQIFAASAVDRVDFIVTRNLKDLRMLGLPFCHQMNY
jgi:predicted nucleic acid-binding protein